MLPAAVQRIWWPHTVVLPMTDHGMSLKPSSSCAACTGGEKLAPLPVRNGIWPSIQVAPPSKEVKNPVSTIA